MSAFSTQHDDRPKHSERNALLITIRKAIDEQWGPFNGIPKEPIITDLASINNNLTVLQALQQLKIYIYSERSPCDYRANKHDVNPDKGCTPYLENLNKMLGNDSIMIYHALSKYTPENLSLNLVQEFPSPNVLESNTLYLKKTGNQLEYIIALITHFFKHSFISI